MEFTKKTALFVTEAELNESLLDWAKATFPSIPDIHCRLDSDLETEHDYPNSIFVELSTDHSSLLVPAFEKLFDGTDFLATEELDEEETYAPLPEEISRRIIAELIGKASGLKIASMDKYSNAKSNGIVAYSDGEPYKKKQSDGYLLTLVSAEAIADVAMALEAGQETKPFTVFRQGDDEEETFTLVSIRHDGKAEPAEFVIYVTIQEQAERGHDMQFTARDKSALVEKLMEIAVNSVHV